MASTANPKSASFTLAPGTLLARRRFSGWEGGGRRGREERERGEGGRGREERGREEGEGGGGGRRGREEGKGGGGGEEEGGRRGKEEGRDAFYIMLGMLIGTGGHSRA